MKKHILLVAAGLCLLCGPMQAQEASKKVWEKTPQQEKQLVTDIEKYAQEVKDTWQIPGFAMAVSLDNKVIFKKGFGVKELRPKDGVGFAGMRYDNRSLTGAGVKGVVNKPGEKIQTNTLFQIASVSKSFTATVMAQLVNEGKVKWTDTVKNILPDFKMFKNNDYVTENMLVRDAFLHATGLANEAGTYFGCLGYDREDTYKMLGELEPGFSFRGDYDYNNISFVVAEKVIEKVTGKSWEENVRERVFKPLGMTSSTMNGDGFANAKNVATPHDYTYDKDGKVATLPLYADEQALAWLTAIGPAGSVCSTAEDLIKYAQFHCNNGYIVNRDSKGNVIDTTVVMPRKAMLPLHRGYTITGQDSVSTRTYGMCWFIEQNNNYRLLFHTGTAWGMTALCFYVPEYKLAGVILVNCESGANPRYAIMRRIIDLVREAPAPLKDWSGEYWDSYVKSSEERIAKRAAQPKPELVPEVADPSIFAGQYVKDELFGDIYITKENGSLYFELGKRKGQPGFKNVLKHVNGNTYRFRSDGHAFNVTFKVCQKSGNVKGLSLEFGEGEEKSFGGWMKQNFVCEDGNETHD
ncbi:MAG: serine hydrolase [Candidatus Egerieousia sp.]